MRLPSVFRSLRALFGDRRQLDREIREELGSHIQHRADDLQRRGLSRTEAERRAHIEFGGYEKFNQDCHEEQRGHFFETLWQDVRFAVRLLSKSPGFTGIAVITMALGIGANAVAFSLMNALILRPLNVPHAQNLYTVERSQGDDISQSYPDYLDLRDRNQTLDGIVAYSITRAGLDTNGKATSAWLYQASGNYFDVLGVRPYLGRLFHSSDEHGVNSAPYLVLSYPYWQNHFGGDPSVVGRTVQVNKHPFTMIGVAPAEVRGTEMGGGTVPGRLDAYAADPAIMCSNMALATSSGPE